MNNYVLNKIALKIPELRSICKESGIEGVSMAYGSPVSKKIFELQNKLFQISVNLGKEGINPDIQTMLSDLINL